MHSQEHKRVFPIGTRPLHCYNRRHTCQWENVTDEKVDEEVKAGNEHVLLIVVVVDVSLRNSHRWCAVHKRVEIEGETELPGDCRQYTIVRHDSGGARDFLLI